MDYYLYGEILSLVVSGIGFVLFFYGKKQQRIPQMVAGVFFILYPYMVSSILSLVLGSVVLGAGLWVAVWMGY